MKFATVSKSVLMGLALFLATSAFAATRGSLQLGDEVKLNGTTLKAGDYKVEWDGAGPNVELSILKGKKVVAKTEAQMVDLAAPAPSDAAITVKNASGPNSLTGIRFQGKKYSLNLASASDGMSEGSSK
jgi:hypothetical protein